MMIFKRFIASLLPLLLFVTLLPGSVRAALLDVGPVVPELVGSSPPKHGFPLWYRDTSMVPLELCLSTATSPTVPGALMCTLLPGPGFDPALPMSFTGNFPDELFWWTGDARVTGALLTNPSDPRQKISFDASIIMALEGAFPLGVVQAGDQASFARIRILMDTVIPGSYRVIHPYGENTFVITQADIDANGGGNRIVFFTEDIGLAPGGNFNGALQGRLGPFLRWDTGAPINVNGELFVGDPSVDHTVSGSPFGTNFLRVEGPAGSNLDGLGNSFVQTNLFAVSGKLYTATIPTPLKVDKAVYTREPGIAYVSVFGTTRPISNATNPAAPFPANFAQIGTLSSLQASGTGIPTKTMATRNQADGKFFSSTGVFPPPATLPATIRVTNTTDIPPTSVDVPLVDEVTVSQANYRPLTKTLNVAAASSDKIAPPTLQVFMPGMAAPLGTMAAGQLSVTFPVVDSTVNPPKTYQIPPLTVTVRSAAGGEVTVPVVAQDVP